MILQIQEISDLTFICRSVLAHGSGTFYEKYFGVVLIKTPESGKTRFSPVTGVG